MVKDHQDDLKKFKQEADATQDPTLKQIATQGSTVISQHLQLAEQVAKNHNIPVEGGGNLKPVSAACIATQPHAGAGLNRIRIESGLAAGARLLQRILQSRHADARRGLRRARAAPVCLQAHRVAIPVLRQSPATAPPNPPRPCPPAPTPTCRRACAPRSWHGNGRCDVFGSRSYPFGYGIASGNVAALPGSQFSMKFGSVTAASVAADSAPVAVLHAISFSSNKNHLVLRAALRRLAQLVVDGRAIRLHILQPPEIEAANAIRRERLGQLDALLQQRILRLEIGVGMKLIAAARSASTAARPASPP